MPKKMGYGSNSRTTKLRSVGSSRKTKVVRREPKGYSMGKGKMKSYRKK